MSGLNRRPAIGLTYAAKVARAAVLKAPVRDLILGVATLILLLIVGAQSKLLVWTHEAGSAAADATRTLASQNQAGSAGAAAKELSANSATSSKAVRAASSKTVASAGSGLRPAKEVVVPLSTVELAVRHQFKDATLSVWVDDRLVLTRSLHGGTQKRMVVFGGGVRGVESETLKVPAGKHTLRFRTQTDDQTVDISKTVTAVFVGGGDKTLEISFDKHNTAMRLVWQ
jgi:hypothetical protein